MATISEVSPAPWRMRLVPASFARIEYHVEQQARSGGRRVVVHEYPKRDEPYSEDMGRHAIRYNITGYLIGPDYHLTKERLVEALDTSPGAPLVDPYIGRELICICERYSVTEVRERGGYCVFEMLFVQVGSAANSKPQTNTASDLSSKAKTTGSATASLLDTMPTSL